MFPQVTWGDLDQGELKMAMLENAAGEVEDPAGVSSRGPDGGGLVLPEEVLASLAGQLAQRARAGEPVTLTGPGGLLTGVIGQVLQAGLAAELAGHLEDGDAKQDISNKAPGDSRPPHRHRHRQP